MSKLKFRPFVETKNCIDEYADDHTIGVFASSGYCLAGVRIQPAHHRDTGEGEAYAVIVANRAAGIWRDPDPDLPPSGF